MQYKPGNWVTGFKRSPRAANVQNRDMGLFLNSSGKFEPIDDSWDNLHSGGLFISDDNKLYFRDETNKDIYINSPADNQLALYASAGVGINVTPDYSLHVVGDYNLAKFNTTRSGSDGVYVQLEHFSSSPANDDNLAYLIFKGYNDAVPPEEINYGVIETQSADIENGTEDGKMIFRTMVAGTDTRNLVINNGYVGIGTDSPSVGLEVEGGNNTAAKIGIINTAPSPDNSWTIHAQYNDQTLRFLGDSTTVLQMVDTGEVGIGATPGTLFEMTSTAPYLTIKNSTHEDTEGGRESKIIFEGEQSGGEITTLAQIQASHDGTSDDEKGDLIFSTNDGSDGASPTPRMRIDSAGKVGIGTDDPAQKLQVKGTNALGLEVEDSTNYWAVYPYTDNTLRLNYNNSGSDELIMYSDGAMRLAYQPAFRATVNAAQNNMAIDTEVTIVLGAVPFDQGGDFTSNTFTAPVAGRYQFSANILFNNIDSAANWYKLTIKTDGGSYADLYTPLGLSADIAYQTFTVSILADMDLGDTASLIFQQDGGTAQTDIINSALYASFSGFLAC